jgi:hypothetical protein
MREALESGCCRESLYATATNVPVGATTGPRAIHERAGVAGVLIVIDMNRLLSW